MADDPQEFMGTKEQYERLRGALTKLTGDGVRPVTILALAKVRCDRGVINKFCKPDGTDRISFNIAAALWTYPAAKQPDLLGLTAAPVQPLFHALVKYYDVHKHRTGPRMSYIEGLYQFYQYSEEFNNHSPALQCAVVVGEFRVGSQDGAITIDEMQSYDGHLGKIPMTEISTGYCFPKGHEFFFLMKTAERETPKFYVFYYAHIDGTPPKVQVMKGYMLKGSYDGPYFHSPVYVLRANSDPVACNILRPDEVPPHILTELGKELPMMRPNVQKHK